MLRFACGDRSARNRETHRYARRPGERHDQRAGRVGRDRRREPGDRPRDHEFHPGVGRRSAVPTARHRRQAIADDAARRRRHRRATPDRERPRRFEAVELPRVRLRNHAARERQGRECRLARVAAAEGRAAARRDRRRHRLPDEEGGQRVPGVQRRDRLAVRDDRREHREAESGSRAARRRLSLPRERVPARHRRLQEQPVGLRLGRVARGSVRARRAAARESAVGRRARQP